MPLGFVLFSDLRLSGILSFALLSAHLHCIWASSVLLLWFSCLLALFFLLLLVYLFVL